MTVLVDDRRREYPGDGVADTFNGPMAYAANHLAVYLRDDVTLVATLQLPSVYTVTGLGLKNGTTVRTNVAPPTGQTLLVLRIVPYDQSVNITDQSAFNASVLEKSDDLLAMQIQQVVDRYRFVLQWSETLPDGSFNAMMPDWVPGAPLMFSMTTPYAIEAGDLVGPGDLLLRPDLLSDAIGKGASLVTFKQTGAGAIARTMMAKAQERLTPQDFGALGNGVADDTVAFMSAITEAVARGTRRVDVPSGIYNITESPELSLLLQTGFALIGDGSSNTELRFTTPSGDGIRIESPSGNWWLGANPHNKVLISGISITTTKANVGTGLYLEMGSLEGRPAPQIVLEDVEVRAATGFGQYFARSFHFHDTSSVIAAHCRSIMGGPGNTNGTSFLVTATDGTTDPTDINFIHCKALFGARCYEVTDYVEGVYLTQCDGINATNGLFWNVSSESGLHVVGGHFNTFGNAFDLAGMLDGAINGVLIFRAGGVGAWSGIKCRNGGSMTINNNVIRAANLAGVTAIDIDDVPNEGTHGYMVNGNQISGVEVGITLGPNSRKVQVGINAFLNVNARVIDQGTNNNVWKRTYTPSITVNTLGGAPTELVTVPIQNGTFLGKPASGFATSPTQDMIGIYDYSNAGNSATAAVFLFRKRDGTNIGAGPNRLNLMLVEE